MYFFVSSGQKQNYFKMRLIIIRLQNNCKALIWTSGTTEEYLNATHLQRREKHERCILGIVVKTYCQGEEKESNKKNAEKEMKRGRKKKERIANVRLQCSPLLDMMYFWWEYEKYMRLHGEEATWWAVGLCVSCIWDNAGTPAVNMVFLWPSKTVAFSSYLPNTC